MSAFEENSLRLDPFIYDGKYSQQMGEILTDEPITRLPLSSMLIFLLSALIPGWLNARNVIQRQKKDLDILNKLVALLRWLRFNRQKEQGQTFSRWKDGQLAQFLKLRKGEK